MTPRARPRSAQLGLGRVGQRQPGDGGARRRDARRGRGPSNHNAVALILPHKAMLGFDGGAIGADIYCDRSGIHARRIEDCAKVLDALKDRVDGYLRSARSVHDGAALVGAASYPTSHATAAGAPGALKGMRIGVIRKSMAIPAASRTEVPIVTRGREGDQINRCRGEISARRWWSRASRPGGPTRPGQMGRSTTAARWRGWCRCSCPTCCSGSAADGTPVFKEFAAAIVPTEFAPGKVFGTGTMPPIDYLVELAEGRIAPPPISISPRSRRRNWRCVPLPHLAVPVAARRGLEGQRLYRDAHRLAGAQRTLEILGRRPARGVQELGGGVDPRNPHGRRQGVDERIMLRELLPRST